MTDFRGKNVLITGAGSGIGKALALEFAKKGSRLFLAARRQEELKKVAEECIALGTEAKIFFLDIAEESSVDALVKSIAETEKNIDVLVNNAGVSQRSEAFITDWEVDKRIMQVNFFGQVYLLKKLKPLMPINSHVVVISSLVGLMGFPLRTAYAASKHALNGYFEALQVENNELNITIACPGRIQSDISVHALTADGSEHKKMDKGQALGMPAQECAKKIIRAAAGKRKLVLIGRKELLLYYIKKVFPFLFYKIASKINPS